MSPSPFETPGARLLERNDALVREAFRRGGTDSWGKNTQYPLADLLLTRRLFGSMLRRIAALSRAAGPVG